MDKEKKKKLGIGIYYTAMILTIVIMLLTLVLIKSDDAVYVSRMRYLISFYCFDFLLGGGIIIREFLVEEYLIKKMIIKIVATISSLIIGTIMFFIIPTAQVGLMILLVGMGVLLYDMFPTVPKDGK